MFTRAPVCSASMQSRATSTSSASAGAPPSPSAFDTAPWFTPGDSMNARSSSWNESGRSSFAARSIAHLTRASSISGMPSSVKPAAPWAASSSMSTSSRPCMPRLMVAHVSTLMPQRAPRSST